jgi:hypothetical protein
VEWLVISRRVGDADTEPPGCEPHGQRDRNRIELGGTNAVTDRFPEIVAVAVRYREPVIKEREMEFSPLQCASDILVVFA